MERRIRKLQTYQICHAVFLFLRKPISKLPNAQMVKTEEQNNCVTDESSMALLTSLDLLEQN